MSTSVEFLVRDVGRNVDEIAGAGFVDEFETVAPTETGAAAYDINDGFEFAVVVRAGFRVGVDNDRAGPKFLGANFRMRDGFGAGHTRCLRGVGVELTGANDADAVMLPVGSCWCRHELPGLSDRSSQSQADSLVAQKVDVHRHTRQVSVPVRRPLPGVVSW
jgi:hypothetical protein